MDVYNSTYDFKSDKESKVELDLTIRAQRGDLMARKELVRRTRGLRAEIIRTNFYNANIPESAIQAHALELLDEAINSFDPSKKAAPSSWFYYYINNKLRRYVDERRFSVRIPEQHKADTTRLKTIISNLNSELNRFPSFEEMSRRMNEQWGDTDKGKIYTPKHAKKLYNYIRHEIPASQSHGEDGEDSITIGELTNQEDIDSEGSLTEELMSQRALSIINTFPEPDRSILLHSWGMGGYERLSPRNLALRLGLSRYMVQKKLDDATKKFADQYNA